MWFFCEFRRFILSWFARVFTKLWFIPDIFSYCTLITSYPVRCHPAMSGSGTNLSRPVTEGRAEPWRDANVEPAQRVFRHEFFVGIGKASCVAAASTAGNSATPTRAVNGAGTAAGQHSALERGRHDRDTAHVVRGRRAPTAQESGLRGAVRRESNGISCSNPSRPKKESTMLRLVFSKFFFLLSWWK